MVGNIIKFIIMLPIRIIAIPIIVLLKAVSLAVGLVNAAGSVVIGLFNLLMILAVLGIVLNQDWHMLWNAAIVFIAEGAILAIGATIQGGIEILGGMIKSSVFGISEYQ